MEVLIIGKDGVGLGAEEVIVPNTQQGQNDGHIFFGRGGSKMLIHGVGAGKQGFEAFHTNEKSNREPNGAPEGISAADPIPEPKHIFCVDAEPADRFFVG